MVGERGSGDKRGERRGLRAAGSHGDRVAARGGLVVLRRS
jgi:hypothetical protein